MTSANFEAQRLSAEFPPEMRSRIKAVVAATCQFQTGLAVTEKCPRAVAASSHSTCPQREMLGLLPVTVVPAPTLSGGAGLVCLGFLNAGRTCSHPEHESAVIHGITEITSAVP